MIRVLFFLIFLVGCGAKHNHVIKNPKDVPRGGPTNDEFVPYVRDYEALNNMNVNTPIQFTNNLNKNIAGVCYTWNNGDTKILINTDIWENRFTKDQREVLIWHELGHCEAKLKHDDELLSDYCPKSIMHYAILDQVCIDKDKKGYFDRFVDMVGF